MVVITIGEMVVSPVQQSLVASFAPEDMRGRYMAVSGLSWGLSFAFGPWLAGLLMENANPVWLWIASGALGLIATAGFYVLDKIHHTPVSVPGEPAAAD
jgi:MFS family permease